MPLENTHEYFVPIGKSQDVSRALIDTPWGQC